MTHLILEIEKRHVDKAFKSLGEGERNSKCCPIWQKLNEILPDHRICVGVESVVIRRGQDRYLCNLNAKAQRLVEWFDKASWTGSECGFQFPYVCAISGEFTLTEVK